VSKFLLDANLSPETRKYLAEKFKLDTIDLITEKKSSLSDNAVVKLAKLEKRIIITFDLDFGEIYYFSERGEIGVIVLRIKDQTVESVNKTLDKFFQNEASSINLERSLIIIDDNKVRIVEDTD